jgi:hypothetical protein
MDAGEEVHEQIARNAGAVVAIVAPAEEADRIERTLRRAPEKTVPIDRLRRRVGRNRVLPSAERRVAVDPRFDQIHVADRAGAKQIARLGVDNRAGVLAADLQDAAALPRGVDDAQTLLELLHHRLLDVDVLARFHRVDRHLRMPVIRRGDDDRIDVRTRENLAVVARGEQVCAPGLPGERQAAVVDIGDRDERDAGRLKR